MPALLPTAAVATLAAVSARVSSRAGAATLFSPVLPLPLCQEQILDGVHQFSIQALFHRAQVPDDFLDRERGRVHHRLHGERDLDEPAGNYGQKLAHDFLLVTFVAERTEGGRQVGDAEPEISDLLARLELNRLERRAQQANALSRGHDPSLGAGREWRAMPPWRSPCR